MKGKKGAFNGKIQRILCLVLAVFLCIGSVLFSGCFEDEKAEAGETFFERYVDGVSTVYADMEGQDTSDNQIIDNLGSIIVKINNGLLGNYGNGIYEYTETEEEKTITSNYKYGDNAPFPDSIRMLVYADVDGKAKVEEDSLESPNKWNWLIDPDWDGSSVEDFEPTEDQIYSDWKASLDLEYDFRDFSDYFQVVLYEIMLGYEELSNLEVITKDEDDNPTYVIKVELKNYNAETKKYSTEDQDALSKAIGSIKIGEIDGSGYLAQLQDEYMASTRYTGLTKQNADKLIDYILHEIIGAELVVYDYKTFANQPVNYRNYVSTIAYLIYSQTFDGKDEDWVYTFTSGETEILYTFNVDERKQAVYNGLLGSKQEGEMSAQNPKQEGGFTAKAATYVKYFEGEKFFGSAEEGVVDQFAEAGAPYAEYQSVVLVPRKSLTNLIDGGLKLESGFVYSVMSKNKDLRIRTTIRVKLQNENGEWFLYEFDGPEVDFSSATSFVNEAGETCYEDTFDFGINASALDESLIKTSRDKTGYESESFTVGFFDEELVNDLNNVGDDNNLGDNPGLQNLYKVVASKNGYGALTVLDEDKVDFSFYEICLDVVKSPNDEEGTDYKFSMVLSNTGLWPGIC